MKIAIYGDSFGTETPIFETEHPNLSKVGTPWVSLLRQHYNVDNYCVSGSDYYFSFNNFLKNYKRYDINIFIETACNRLSIKQNNVFVHNHNIQSATAKLKDSTDNSLNNIYKASVQYFTHLHDIEKDEVLTSLMRKEIERLDSNCFFIKSFGEHGLFNITLNENKIWKVNPTYTKDDKFLDLRYCHMTKENNHTLYKIVYDKILTKEKFSYTLDDFVGTRLQDKNLYLVKK